MEAIFQIAIVVMSVVIHEVSHGFMARHLGDNTAEYAGRLTLNPIKHADLFGSIIIPGILALSKSDFLIGWAKPVPVNPYNLKNQKWGEALVSFAGPLSNFVVAILFGLILRFGLIPENAINIVVLIVITNLGLAFFNLVPIPPLDGSKILFSMLPLRFLWVRDHLEKYGLFLALFFAFFLWQYFYPLIVWSFKLVVGVA